MNAGLAALAELARHREQNQIVQHLPYGHPDTLCPDGAVWREKHEAGEWTLWTNKPWQWDFFAAGATAMQRMLIAANRVGKTRTAGDEMAYHLTGEYPDWWEGKRFKKPVNAWTGSPTNETSRDIIQKELLGKPDENNEYGSGTIPKRLIHKVKPRQAGISDVADFVTVKHVSGGLSTLTFKSYDQGWKKWQGTAIDVCWLDEEPDDFKIFTEALTRLGTTSGIMMVTYTPLMGITELYQSFINNPSAVIVRATWDDAPHLTEEAKANLKSGYPEWEMETRTMGVPMMGTGRVFQISEKEIVCEPFKTPPHWPQIHGIDFGIEHPAAGVRWAWDRDNDVAYLIWCYRKRNETVSYHAAALNGPGGEFRWIPVAWPHDGMNRDKGKGRTLAQVYADYGVNMLHFSARYEDKIGGGQGQEQIIMEVIERARTGRLKVFSTCHEWLEEFRNYHRKDGNLVNKNEDTLKASFYGLMMLRYAQVQAPDNKGHSPYQRPIF